MIEYERVYYDSGKLKQEIPLKDDEEHGIEKCWYESGQLEHEHPWQEGERHGVDKGWWPDGKLDYTRYYLYGNKVTEEEYRKHELIEKLSGL